MDTTCWPHELHIVVQDRMHSSQHRPSVGLYKADQFVEEFFIKFSCVSLIQELFLFPILRNKFITPQEHYFWMGGLAYDSWIVLVYTDFLENILIIFYEPLYLDMNFTECLSFFDLYSYWQFFLLNITKSLSQYSFSINW